MDALFLVLTLAERFGLLVGGMFLLLTFTPVQRIGFARNESRHRTLFLILFFGIFGIIGTYTGNSVFQSVANLRAMAVITGGLFGGPAVGIGAGLIAGLHRILVDLHGFSSVPCGMATALEGAIAGIIAMRLGQQAMSWKIAVPLTFLGECMHMLLVLKFSRSYDEAVALVKLIAPPMITINTCGSALCVEIINIFFRDRDRRESIHAQKILDIANLTVSYLRSGLSLESAQATAQIIHDRVGVAAVAITDTHTVLAHIGQGADHHKPDHPIGTRATRDVLQTGIPVHLRKPNEIGCDAPHCPFTGAAVVPLEKNGKVVGTLKFYGCESHPMNITLFELAKGLGNLFSTQLELEDIQIKERMLAHAEIRRLQAQINPHFLFNSLNTITSFCRTNAEKARELLLDLSLYMRKNLDSSRGFVPLSDELEQVRSYFAIEQARFGERIRVIIDVEESCAEWPIPPLIIQPLVENSVKHGILAHEDGGVVELHAQKQAGNLHVTVYDDGVGMDDETLHTVLTRSTLDSHTSGIGVLNCSSRLEQIYGPQYGLHIVSDPGQGTRIEFTIPPQPLGS